jgi:hypothetical protein
MVPAVLWQPEVGSSSTQPHVSVDQRSTAPGNDQTREDVGVTIRPIGNGHR